MIPGRNYEKPLVGKWPIILERNILSGELTEDVTPGGRYGDDDFE